MEIAIDKKFEGLIIKQRPTRFIIYAPTYRVG